jgi:hypothetical protein
MQAHLYGNERLDIRAIKLSQIRNSHSDQLVEHSQSLLITRRHTLFVAFRPRQTLLIVTCPRKLQRQYTHLRGKARYSFRASYAFALGSDVSAYVKQRLLHRAHNVSQIVLHIALELNFFGELHRLAVVCYHLNGYRFALTVKRDCCQRIKDIL